MSERCASVLMPGPGVSRRVFLKCGAALSTMGNASAMALGLAAASEVAALTASDYKALVCVFLHGGNDCANTLVPYDEASHALYRSLRPTLALNRSALGATLLRPRAALNDGRQYSLGPGLAALLPMFDARRMAVLLNLGPLVEPTSKAQYVARAVPLPRGLISHNDQASIWQSGEAEGAHTGWGGRMGDIFAAGNGGSSLTCIGVSGNAVHLAGQETIQYQISPDGPTPVRAIKQALFGSTACSQALEAIASAPSAHWFEDEYAKTFRRGLEIERGLRSALAGVPVFSTFPTTGLGRQLQMVARLIAARQSLGLKRQVFFVSMGGFDTHFALLAVHQLQLAAVANALSAFYQTLGELGLGNKVTTFTASDFGRTLVSNSSGSDYGWGSMHLVLGDSVNGGSFFGHPPELANNGPDDVGQGRLLPTMAVEQLGATLAGWLGLSAQDQQTVFPLLKNFSTTDLGFMKPA